MCIYYYLHYHHIPPCMRDIEYAIHYNFCANSTFSAVAAHLSPTGEEQLIQHPCETLLYGPDHQPQDYDPVTGQAITTGAANNHAHQSNTNSHHNSYNSSNNNNNGSEAVFDYNNPCATGGCLVSQGCGSGQCRLEQLGGRWICCRCRRGGNSFRWCAHPMRRVPDTLCYHTVCLGCWADDSAGQQGGGG
ncbi:hypothetical protein PG994_009555 [Apiospora phragmitis]|uniref:Uncharacterized protein n=1 Tax=Apiospora phragmitis TaxID=2905665 RepID=A0ABR1U6I2_9PEZI